MLILTLAGGSLGMSIGSLFSLALALSVLFLGGCRSVGTATLEQDRKATASGVEYAWVQLGEGQAASARAILPTPNAPCPRITVDNQPSAPMNVRTMPTAYSSSFGAITVCEYPLTPVTQVSIDDGNTTTTLYPPTGRSDTILVLGDTGCRLKGNSHQWCQGGSLRQGQWGFPPLSASAAAGPQPDMILHVGDYLYRESTGTDGTTCDPYNPARGWIHCGDNWPAWEDEFFAPAQAGGLLSRAPWLYVRGNHEDCSRAWKGYFLFFYPHAVPSACQDVIAPYPVNLQGLDIYVVDTSNESSSAAQTSLTAVNNDLSNTSNPQAAWLTTHVPMSDLAPAYANSGLANQGQLKWIHVGHIHFFQQIDATNSQQPETITGGSGTKLDSCHGGGPTCSLNSSAGCCYGKISSTNQDQYTYLTVTFDAQRSQWNATLHDLNGAVVYTFTVTAM